MMYYHDFDFEERSSNPFRSLALWVCRKTAPKPTQTSVDLNHTSLSALSLEDAIKFSESIFKGDVRLFLDCVGEMANPHHKYNSLEIRAIDTFIAAYQAKYKTPLAMAMQED